MRVTAEAVRRADSILERLGLAWHDLTEQQGDFRPVGRVAAEVVADLRFRRRVQQVHRLGARAVGELLAELGAERSIMTLIDQKLSRYANLDPEAVEATGAGDFWPEPIHEVKPDDES